MTATSGRNLVLVGMMGVGKSTVGAILAERLARPLVETDALVEGEAGRRISEIFAEEGEAGFRERERRAVKGAASRGGQVVSAGGGAVLDDRNVAELRRHGVLVLLDAPADVLATRLETASDRPLLDDEPPRRLHALLDERAPAYREVADHTVDATAGPEAVVADILSWAAGRGDVLSDDERGRVT